VGDYRRTEKSQSGGVCMQYGATYEDLEKVNKKKFSDPIGRYPNHLTGNFFQTKMEGKKFGVIENKLLGKEGKNETVYNLEKNNELKKNHSRDGVPKFGAKKKKTEGGGIKKHALKGIQISNTQLWGRLKCSAVTDLVRLSKDGSLFIRSPSWKTPKKNCWV